MCSLVSAVCEGTETFERVTGVLLHSATQIPLYSSQGAVTTQCTSRCRASTACPSFLVDYDRGACFRLDLTSEGRTHLLVPARGHTAYFEKVCLQAPACGKAWVFERVLGRELAGLDDLVLEEITSRRTCEEYCLLNHQLPCRSAEFVASQRLCRLSSSSRRTAPNALRPALDTEYLENQCVPHVSSTGCDWEKRPERQMTYRDLEVSATSRERV
ncbi:uncharacterized protein LOC122383576 [Amphibalanus amphitrite]|uniref:uncharacterized protein LOC122383576 n=1 Tax=Amphibalanus amphitrite TaxID=1232801 RepID=UPI001C8FBD90|nr:uncharacterized protein LOC122383576 [Amphibalanus amphitrite]